MPIDNKRKMNPFDEDVTISTQEKQRRNVQSEGEYQCRKKVLKQVAMCLSDEISLIRVAKRYEKILFQSSNSFSDYCDTTTIKERVRSLLFSDSPYILVGELFVQVPPHQQQNQNPLPQKNTAPFISLSNFSYPSHRLTPTPPVPGFNTNTVKEVDRRNWIESNTRNFVVDDSLLRQQPQHDQHVACEDLNPPVLVHTSSGGSHARKVVFIDTPRALPALAEMDEMCSEDTETKIFLPEPTLTSLSESRVFPTSYRTVHRRHSNGASGSANYQRSQATTMDSSSHANLATERKQKRLMELHHSATCQCPQEVHCSVSPHCREMKLLWSHLETCTNARCRVRHCLSSRTILAHYRRCQNEYCNICTPVKAHISQIATSTSNHISSSIIDVDGQIDLSDRSSFSLEHSFMPSETPSIDGVKRLENHPADNGMELYSESDIDEISSNKNNGLVSSISTEESSSSSSSSESSSETVCPSLVSTSTPPGMFINTLSESVDQVHHHIGKFGLSTPLDDDSPCPSSIANTLLSSLSSTSALRTTVEKREDTFRCNGRAIAQMGTSQTLPLGSNNHLSSSTPESPLTEMFFDSSGAPVGILTTHLSSSPSHDSHTNNRLRFIEA